MTLYCLRLLVKLFRINALVNKDEHDSCILFELWLKNGKKLEIDFYPLSNLSSFIYYLDCKDDNKIHKSTSVVLYKKTIEDSTSIGKYTSIELPWLYIYYG